MTYASRPRACGALGTFDRARVLRAAGRLGPEMRAVHEDERSILLLDREPIAWQGRSQRGFGWIEGDLWRGASPSRWQDAAVAGACGLVVEGRRRFLHSSVSGLAPVYWMDDGGAAYFCSSIDPLVAASPGPLTIDWQAWRGIIALRFPLAGRTPFAEIRRLGPHSRLRRRLGRARVKAEAWPWAEVEPSLSVEQGAEIAAEAMRAALEPLDGEVLCPLSGGHDSRAACSAAPRSARRIAVTVSDDEGERFEEAIAEEVADALGIPWEELGARADDYERDWNERARRVEYQFVDHAWLVPLAHRVDGAGAPVLDGFALDTFQQTGARFQIGEVLATRGRASDEALFDALRQYGDAPLALREPFRAPIVERARDEYLDSTRPFWGHTSQPILSTYVTRSVGGVARYPTGLLGEAAQVVVPGVNDPVVRALLSVSSDAKASGGMRDALLERLDPRTAGIRATMFTPRNPPELPRRWCSQPAVAMYRKLLREGPLAEHVSPELWAWLDDPGRGELSPDLRMGMEGIALFHAWWLRYRDRLRDADPAELADA